MMMTEENSKFLIRAKTGWAALSEDDHTGWWVGWVEKGSTIYTFATVLHTNNPGETFGAARVSATREVLELLGIIDLNE